VPAVYFYHPAENKQTFVPVAVYGCSVAEEIDGTVFSFFFSAERSDVAVFIDLLSASITAARNGDGIALTGRFFSQS